MASEQIREESPRSKKFTPEHMPSGDSDTETFPYAKPSVEDQSESRELLLYLLALLIVIVAMGFFLNPHMLF